MSRTWFFLLISTLIIIIVAVGVRLSLHHPNTIARQGDDGYPPDTTTISDARHDRIPEAFAAMLRQTYTFDTLDGVVDHLPADTSYVALPTPEVSGRKIAISICGVDARFGASVEHADANHVLIIRPDSGKVDIISIPRDTPYDAGYVGAARNHYNILANVRARKGRDAYLKAVADLAGLDTVQYYLDLGFSQARGLLELLGFRQDAGNALRVLRSRQAFASGDFQRCFNQAQFIRQTLLNRWDAVGTLTGDVLVRAGLYLVSTNLTMDVIKDIHSQLKASGFPRNAENINVCIKPAYYARMAVFNFSDSLVLGSLLRRINEKADKHGITRSQADSDALLFRQRLDNILALAIADSARKPLRVIARLQRSFEQRIWWQIADRTDRARVRTAIGSLLQSAYIRTGKNNEAARIQEVLRFEEQMFSLS